MPMSRRPNGISKKLEFNRDAQDNQDKGDLNAGDDFKRYEAGVSSIHFNWRDLQIYLILNILIIPVKSSL